MAGFEINTRTVLDAARRKPPDPRHLPRPHDRGRSLIFGWSACETRMIGDVIHFTARTIRPDVPHTVVWYGTVDGDALKVDAT